MALHSGKLFAGALFTGTLFGAGEAQAQIQPAPIIGLYQNWRRLKKVKPKISDKRIIRSGGFDIFAMGLFAVRGVAVPAKEDERAIPVSADVLPINSARTRRGLPNEVVLLLLAA